MASRRKTTRQQGSTSNGTEIRSGGDGGPSRELLQQYTEGKKFKVKYLGSHDIEDYRNKRETSSIMSDLKKRSSKAPKPKAIISLYSKELVVLDEKSKTVTMKVPVSKVKFVCHDKRDPSLFGVILATDRITSDSQRLHRMFCYQTDPKVAGAFVRSVNELFQLLAAIMQERRSRAAEANGRGGDAAAGGGASATGGGATSGEGGVSGGRTNQSQGSSEGQQQQAGATGGDPMSDDERYEPVPLGFGIEAPPPSYKAAISKKNEAIFMKPDDIKTTVNTRLPPPPPSTRPKKPAPPPPAARLSAPPTSQGRRPAAQEPPTPTSTATSQVATPTTRIATPTSATSLPLPQVPVTSTSSNSRGATFNLGATDEEDTGFDPNAEGNIYDVPTNNQPAPHSQEQRQAVWQEWQALESELQTIAQDLGFDMDSNNSIGAVGATAAAFPSIEEMNIPPPNVTSHPSFSVSQSFSSSVSEDPFADDFFQTSFTSPTASLSAQVAWPEQTNAIETEDPFNTNAGFETAWDTPQTADQSTGVSSNNIGDPFQEGLATPAGSSGIGNQVAAVTSDPFQDSATPTSASTSFDVASFSAQSPWSESASVATTTVSTITQAAPTTSFDEGFGSDWGAFGSITNVTTSASSATFPQPPKVQDSQPEPVAVLSPPPQVTTPRRANTVQTSATTAASTVTTSEDSFAPSPAAVPPPLPKRDSAILMPPPVSPTRRADSISNRNQSTSSRSRPRPSVADQAPAPIDTNVVLNRPAKSKSSPSQTRANSGEIEAQQLADIPPIPAPDFGPAASITSTSFDAMFEANNSDTSGGGMPPDSTVTSDPFQSSPPLASSDSLSDPFQTGQPAPPIPATTTSQVTASDSFQDSPPPTSQATTVSDLFQDSLPPASTVSTGQATFSDPFQNGSPQTSIAASQLSAGNPFQDISPQTSPSATQQAPATDPFQDSFPPLAASVSTTSSDNPFLDSASSSGHVTQPSTASSDPFLSGVPPPASTQAGTISDAQTITSTQASAIASGGGDNWSAFGDMWSSSKKQETTANDDWSAFGSTGSTKTAASTKQGPASKSDEWSAAFSSQSQPQQQEQHKQPATSSFSGFGDNWSGLSNDGKAATSAPQNQPSASGFTEVNTSKGTTVPQNKTESPWDAFGQDSISSPSASTSSSLQSQPQVQQKPVKPAAAGLLPPPGKSSRAGGSPVSSQSRPRARPSGDKTSRSSGILNPPSSQKAQSSKARANQIQAASISRTTAAESKSNPLNKSEVSTKKSSNYLNDLSSLSALPQHQPQFSPMNMNYPGAGGPPFQQQQQPGGWGSPPGSAQSPPFSPPQQQQAFPPYGGPQQGGGGGPGMPLQQQQPQFLQQQQAMFMQQQQAMQQMQQGPPGSIQQGPPGSMQQQPPRSMQQGPPKSMRQGPHGSMQQGPPGSMQQGPTGSMQQGPPGLMQRGYNNMQQVAPGQVAPGQMPMQQAPLGGGVQFSPTRGPQMMGPPGGGQLQQAGPPHFSTPQQQQNFYQQQLQQQQNPDNFSPIGQPNPLTPGNVTAGSNLSTSHLYTSDFSSPPYAVGSSTPQSGAPSSASPPPPPPPTTVEYRPSVNDGRPDPFAALVTGALTPSKDGKVKGVDADKLKAAFIKQPSPNRGFPSSGPTYYGNVSNNNNNIMNPQSGWV